MPTYQDIENPCPYLLFPIGRGIPLCIKPLVGKQDVTKVTLQDLYDCNPRSCEEYERQMQLAETLKRYESRKGGLTHVGAEE